MGACTFFARLSAALADRFWKVLYTVYMYDVGSSSFVIAFNARSIPSLGMA